MSRLLVESSVASDQTPASELAERIYNESLFGIIAFSHEKFIRCFSRTISEPSSYLGLKAHLDGQIIGFCYAIAGEYFTGDGAKVATVIAFATGNSSRSAMLAGKAAFSLTAGIKRWAEKVQADLIMFHVTSAANVTRSDRFFRRLGMKTLGGNYVSKV